jgi:hypothetical protein
MNANMNTYRTYTQTEHARKHEQKHKYEHKQNMNANANRNKKWTQTQNEDVESMWTSNIRVYLHVLYMNLSNEHEQENDRVQVTMHLFVHKVS